MLMIRNTTQLLLTKGDNNPQDDFTLYRGIEYLERKHIIGKVRGYVLLTCVLDRG
jgi:signal peptidase